MLLQKEIVAYLAGHIVTGVSAGLVEITDPVSAKAAVNQVILDELSVEDQLNDEVREILAQYNEYMRREQVSFSDMFRKVKNQLIAERKIIRASGRDTGDGMKLSRDKITDISHKILAAMRQGRYFRLKRPENDIRLNIVKTFTRRLVDLILRQQQRRERLHDIQPNVVLRSFQPEIAALPHRRQNLVRNVGDLIPR